MACRCLSMNVLVFHLEVPFAFSSHFWSLELDPTLAPLLNIEE